MFVAFATSSSAHPRGQAQAARVRRRRKGVLSAAERSKKEAPAEAIFALGYTKRDHAWAVNRVFRTSMEVGVKIRVENPQTGEVATRARNGFAPSATTSAAEPVL